MLTWKASLAALVLLAPGSRQDSDRLVDGMIERSNGLKSFVANYTIRGRTKVQPINRARLDCTVFLSRS